MQVDTMTVLREYNNPTEAEMAKNILDNEGMWCMINNEYMSTIYPTGVMPAQLIVREEDLKRAMELISVTIFEEDEEEL
ncbi:MAG: DUF2007 domain-containing protein [Rikenellaceae bacterium]